MSDIDNSIYSEVYAGPGETASNATCSNLPASTGGAVSDDIYTELSIVTKSANEKFNKTYEVPVPKTAKNNHEDKSTMSNKVFYAVISFVIILVLIASSIAIAALVKLSQFQAQIDAQEISSSEMFGSFAERLEMVEDNANHDNFITLLESKTHKIDQLENGIRQMRNQFENSTQQVMSQLEMRDGNSPCFPLSSCTALPSCAFSGYYWVRASNGSAVHVYCDMTRTCGNVTGGWMRVTELDMTNSSQQCLSGLRQHNDFDLRTCGIDSNSGGCSSVLLGTNTIQYSQVCGRIIAYQFRSTDAFGFRPQVNEDIDDDYVDGVSLTHGPPVRQHIWTFAAALGENQDNDANCPCVDPDHASTPPPSFVGDDYFCDTGNEDVGYRNVLYVDDPLWDGAGCGPQSTCCCFNSPPWFYKQLPQPTTDDIEMRVCRDQEQVNEDIQIEVIEIFVQ